MALALVASLALALLGLPIPVVALFRRIERPNVMDVEARRRVYEHVAQLPGATANQIAQRAGFDRKTVQHHARVLHRLSFLEAQRDGRITRYFLPGAGSRGRAPEGVAARLILLALDRPGLSQAEAATDLDVCRSTIQWHARRLAERGFLERGALRVAREKEAELRALLMAEATQAM
jgi:predicted transcriptional regulator